MPVQAAENHRARSSNLELMRIVLMLLIIMHHAIGLSGVADVAFDDSGFAKPMVLASLGMWGKACINAFVLVTGWFMCTKSLRTEKIVKLFLQMAFYAVTLNSILLVLGLEGMKDFIVAILHPLRDVGSSFSASFLVFYASIPFLNVLLSKLDRGGVRLLLVLLLWTQTVLPTFLLSGVSFYEPVWYATLYILAGYMRLYRPRWSESPRIVDFGLALSVLISLGSVILLVPVANLLNRGVDASWFFMVDSGKVFPLFCGLFCFLWFKKLRMPYVPVVNRLATAVFGVLLIHSNSAPVYTLLWTRIIPVSEVYLSLGPLSLALFLVVVAVVVFGVCAAIDLLRIRFLEPLAVRFIGKLKPQEIQLQDAIAPRKDKK